MRDGPLRVVDWAFNFILERLVAADLQRCTEQYREVRFRSGSTCWKTTNAFSPLGSTSTLSLYLSGALALELSKNNTVSYFPRPKWFNVQLSSKKVGGFVLIHPRHTSPTYSFPVLHLPVFFCLFLYLKFYFSSLWLSFSQIPASDQATFAKNSK